MELQHLSSVRQEGPIQPDMKLAGAGRDPLCDLRVCPVSQQLFVNTRQLELIWYQQNQTPLTVSQFSELLSGVVVRRF